MGTDHARRAYDAMAPFYDDFTAHHHLHAWTTTLEGLAREVGLQGQRLLDVGCGTGKSLIPFLERGWEVTGCDVSREMLEAAAQKAGGRVRLLHHDMRELPAVGTFDLVCCLGDVINYLHTDAELIDAFSGLRRNLAPAGVVVFDVNTLGTLRKIHSSILVQPSPERVLILDGQSSPDLSAGGLAESHIVALTKGAEGWWTRSVSVHRQRHHSERSIRRALTSAGLPWARVRGQDIQGKVEADLDELRDNKAVYLARRDAPKGEGR